MIAIKNIDHAEKKKTGKQTGLVAILVLMLVLGTAGGIIYWLELQKTIYIEKAEINAPIIALAPTTAGVLDAIYVKEGDYVRKNMIVARIGNNPLRAKTDGIVISILNKPGQIMTGADPVVRMIDPKEFRLIGKVEEDKGLNYIVPGQKVRFVVDAFGSKDYYGIVDTVALTARSSDIVFSISDKRETREFEVKVKYDIDSYPELKNGMSAKMWLTK